MYYVYLVEQIERI